MLWVLIRSASASISKPAPFIYLAFEIVWNEKQPPPPPPPPPQKKKKKKNDCISQIKCHLSIILYTGSTRLHYIATQLSKPVIPI